MERKLITVVQFPGCDPDLSFTCLQWSCFHVEKTLTILFQTLLSVLFINIWNLPLNKYLIELQLMNYHLQNYYL